MKNKKRKTQRYFCKNSIILINREYFYLNYYGKKYKSLNDKSETHNIENVNSNAIKYISTLQ